MKYFKYLFLLAGIAFLTSCSFTETMYLNEDGSGKMSMLLDAGGLIGMGGDEMTGSEEDMDSIIDFKTFFEEKKDSISQLSAEEQAKLKKLEKFKLHMVINTADEIMTFDLFTDFNKVEEANDLFDSFNSLEDLGNSMPGEGGGENKDEGKEQLIKVLYSFKKNKFKRDAYIIDKEKYQTQIDSMGGMESFFSGSLYKLEYHFPRKIKETTQESATFSADGKTVFYEIDFLEYMRNPNLLDIEVTLEKK